MEKQYIVAIEIGSSKIVGTLAEKQIPSGSIAIVAIEEVKTNECVRYGCIKNIEETKMCIQNVISKLESHLTDAKITGVYLGISGRSLHNATVTINRNINSEGTTITQATINSLLSEARKDVYPGFEILDVTPQKIIVDNVEVKKPVGSLGSEISLVANVILAKPVLKLSLKRVITNLDIKGYIITPLAVADEILTTNERLLGCMLLDLGAETSTVSFYKNDALIYLATIPLGGRNITRDITSLNMLEDKAEELKRNIGNAITPEHPSTTTIDGIRVSEVESYIAARCGEIVANINEQLTYAGLKIDDLGAGIITIGGGSHLNGMQELLEKATKLKVRRGDYPSYNVKMPRYSSTDAYIQAVSIVSKAAECAEPSIMCIKENEKVIPDPVNPIGTNPTPTGGNGLGKEDPKKPETPNKPKTPSVFSKMFIKVKSLFDEDESIDEEDS